jgi:hypothetical protein
MAQRQALWLTALTPNATRNGPAELESGHEAMLTLPDKLAEILNMVAS